MMYRSEKNRAKVSLASIAEAVGVSRTTVSNAYNRPEQLSPELRQRILETAKRQGYAGPNPAARSLRTRRVGGIGVLLTEHMTYAFEDLASVDFLAGLAAATQGTGNSLTLLPVGPENRDPDNAPATVNSAVIDGLVVYSVAAGDPYLEAAAHAKIPLVVCDQPAEDPRFPYVGIDDFHAIAPAATALVAAGHRDIGILCIRLDPTPNNGFVNSERLHRARLHVQKGRVNGALAVFADAGIDPARVPIVERHINDHANNIDAARQLLSSHPHLTAVLCTTDTMAFGVLAYAASQGISVPGELSVTGFDGIAPALDRGLSTVIQPNKRKGELSARTLFGLLDNEAVEVRTLLNCQFHAGGTVGTPNLAEG